MTDQLYTIEEVAKMLKITRVTLYRLNRRGEIRFVKVAGATRVSGSEIDRYVNAHTYKGEF